MRHVCSIAALAGIVIAATSAASQGQRGVADTGIRELPDGSILFELPGNLADKQLPDAMHYMGGAIATGTEYMAVAASGAEYQEGTNSGVGVVLVYSLKGMTPEQPPELFGVIHIPYETGDGTHAHGIDSVALDIYQDEILVGVSGGDGGDGAVHIYKIDNLDTPFQSVMGSWFFGGNNNYSRLGASVAFIHGTPVGAGMPLGTWFAVGAPEAGPGAVVFFAWEEKNGYYDGVGIEYAPNGIGDYAQFGVSLAGGSWESDTLLVIGAPNANNGALTFSGLVYTLGSDGDIAQTVSPPAPEEFMAFGKSVSMRNNMLAVGAPQSDTNNQGDAFVFEWNTSTDEFDHLATLTPDVSTESDKFGTSIAIGPELIIAVGTPGAIDDGYYSGTCILFDYSPSSQTWIHAARITSYLGGGLFGEKVSFLPDDGGIPGFRALVVGAPSSQTAHMYSSHGPFDPWLDDVRSPTPIRLEDAIAAVGYDGGDDEQYDQWSIAADGDRMVVGETTAAGGDGQVRLYERDSNGQWNLIHTWFAPEAYTYFGVDVDIDGDVVVIADWYGSGSGGPGHGAVYAAVLQYWDNTWSDLMPLDGDQMGETYDFGTSVAVDNGENPWNNLATIAVGEGQNMWLPGGTGRVHLYNFSGWKSWHTGTILEPTNLLSIGGEQENPYFGASVDLDQGFLVVGAPHKALTNAPCFSGAIYLWPYGNFSGPPVYIPNPFGEADCENVDGGGSFGSAVAVHGGGGVIVAGAPSSGEPSTPMSGYAWLFDINQGLQPTPLIPMDQQPGDWFGKSIAIGNGGTVVVGAPGSDFFGVNSGIAWRFGADGKASEALMLENISNQARLGSSVAANTESTRGDGWMFLQHTMLAAAPGQVHETGLGVVGSFTSPVVANWVASGDGWYEANGNKNEFWSMPPEKAAQWRFSKMLGDQFRVEMWDPTSNGAGVEVFLADVRLDGLSNSDSFRIDGGLTVEAPAELGVSRLKLTDLRPLKVMGPIQVGGPDGPGNLVLAENCFVEVLDSLTLNESSNVWIGCGTSWPEDGKRFQCVGQAPVTLGGTCTLVHMDGMSYSVGDRFILLEADVAPPPGSDRFDMVVLPGLPDGLAFQMVYEEVPTFQGGTVWQIAAVVVDLADLIGFGNSGSYAVAGDPIDMELVDLNGDGADEICVLFAGAPGELMIFENDGSGGVTQQLSIGVADQPVGLTTGDFDGDMVPDLALAGRLSLEVQLLFNDGDSDLSSGWSFYDYPLNKPPTCISAVNIDQDGISDLMIGLDDTNSDGDGSLLFLYGTFSVQGGGLNGGGEQGTPGVPVFGDPSDDEDQKNIIGTGSTTTGRAFVVKTSALAFGQNINIENYIVGAGLSGVANADLDNDGDMDIALTSAAGDDLILLRQTSSGGFAAPLYSSLGTNPARVIATDLNGDGYVDLAALTTDENGDRVVRVLQNDGFFSFTSIDTAQGDEPVIFGAGDVTGDGTPDLVTVGGSSNLLGGETQELVLRPQDGACPGDIDGSGSVDIEDLLLVIGQWGNDCEGGEACNADMDGDLDIDVDDLVALIGYWGSC